MSEALIIILTKKSLNAFTVEMKDCDIKMNEKEKKIEIKGKIKNYDKYRKFNSHD